MTRRPPGHPNLSAFPRVGCRDGPPGTSVRAGLLLYVTSSVLALVACGHAETVS